MILRKTTVLLAIALAGWSFVPSQASACGGTFCDASQPVVQAAERIIFSRNDDGTTTAIIQIQYQGPSESFAWILPVQGSPDISVSSDIIFTRLQSATDPQYILNTTIEGRCYSDPPPCPVEDGGWTSDAASVSDASPDSGVEVVDTGSVGPYDFVIISVDPDAEDIGAIASDWLEANGYDVDAAGRDALVPYLETGMNLLAFRLTKGRDTSSIRPVVIDFGAGLASIPLRPTASATLPNMGVMVWMLGDHRAFPVNYLDLELNEARMNWLNSVGGYNALVTAAADEAGGQGFVTEFSGDAMPFQDLLFDPRIDLDLSGLRESDLPDQRLLTRVGSVLSGFDGLIEAILAEVPKPAEVSEAAWRASPLRFLFGGSDIEGFDRAAFLERIEYEVVAPVRNIAARFGNALKVTRMYTTMSAEDMTRDPMFDFNTDLLDYSNVHTASRVIECNGGTHFRNARWRLNLPDGTLVRGEGFQWPSGLLMLPANARTRRLGTSGEGEVVTNNATQIAEGIGRQNERAAFVTWPTPGEDPPPRHDAGCSERDGGSQNDGGSSGSRDSGSRDNGPGGGDAEDTPGALSRGCAVHSGQNSSGSMLFFLVGLAVFRARRRSRA